TGHKPGTIGRPIPGVAVRIVDRTTLQPLPCGRDGLLEVRGGNVMKGYLGRDDLTRRRIVDGWYITGDLAQLDEDGFITLTGRLVGAFWQGGRRDGPAGEVRGGVPRHPADQRAGVRGDGHSRRGQGRTAGGAAPAAERHQRAAALAAAAPSRSAEDLHSRPAR